MNNHKIKFRPKHIDLARHFVRFLDRRWHPDYLPSVEDIKAFVKFESYGDKSLTVEELDAAKILIECKKRKELQIKMLHAEMADWWCHGWGWYYPIAATIKEEFRLRHETKDRIYIRALIKIYRACYNYDWKDNWGFLDVLMSFTGFTQEEKSKYITFYESNK